MAGRSGAATISGFSPDRGTAGTEVLVSGTGLQTTTFVYFGTTEAAGEIVARSASAVRVRVPFGALTGPISVFTSGSGAATSAQVFVAAPRIEGFTPVAGGAGTLVTINGANLGAGTGVGRGNVTNVTIGGARAAFQIVGLNQLKALVPADAVIGPVTVANEAGTSSSFENFQAAALLTGFTPGRGRPGDAIEVRGRNLDGTTRVEFESVPARFTVVSRTNLFVYVPTNALNARLVLTSPAGSVTSASNVVIQPRIFRFTPDSGPVGTEVRVEGGGFHGLTEVQVSGVRAVVSARTSTSITLAVPTGTANGPISVTTTNGSFASEADFHYPIRLNAFSPSAGKRGDTITVDGGFLDGVSSVQLNGVEAVFRLTSNSRMTVTVPAAATTGRLRLVGRSSEVVSTTSFAVRPVLDGFHPVTGPVGSAVFLSGSGLTNLSSVRLGGLDAPFSVINATNVRVVVPAGAYSGRFRVRTSDGSEVESAGDFFVDGARPTVATLTPTNGAVGTRVTIGGQGLQTTTKVQFNGVDAVFEVVSGTQVTATVPAGATTGPVSVTTLDGVGVSVGSFHLPEPRVTLGFQRLDRALVLHWPATVTGYVLESKLTSDLAGAWGPAADVPERVGSEWRVVTGFFESRGRVYRLRKP